MFFGVWELLLVLAIVILIFGASRLPQLGEGLGKVVSRIRESNKDDDSDKSGGNKN